MRAIIPPRRGRTLTVCGHVVSGSLSLPFRGSFHRSLTVLLRYRSGGYLALEGGPPGFPRGSSCPVVLKPPAEARDPLDYRAVTVSGGSSQSASPGASHLVSSWSGRGPTGRCFQLPSGVGPRARRPDGSGLLPVRSPLLGESRLISSPRATEMVQFARFPPGGVGSPPGVRWLATGRVSPFGHPRITACSPLPGAYRRLAASFIGPPRRGVHHAPCTSLHRLSSCS